MEKKRKSELSTNCSSYRTVGAEGGIAKNQERES